jgi:hypothetical protein
LGLLAVATADAVVRVYAPPHPCALSAAQAEVGKASLLTFICLRPAHNRSVALFKLPAVRRAACPGRQLPRPGVVCSDRQRDVISSPLKFVHSHSLTSKARAAGPRAARRRRCARPADGVVAARGRPEVIDFSIVLTCVFLFQRPTLTVSQAVALTRTQLSGCGCERCAFA